MSFIDAKTREKIDSISKDIESFAVLTDDKANKPVNGFDFIPGVGSHSDAVMLHERAKEAGDPAFRTIVMGRFKNGKSTIINSILGEEVMMAKTTACTAVIATVEYGLDEDTVEVVYDDGKPSKKMSLARFSKEYVLTEKDQELFESGENVSIDRFADVSHAVIHRKLDLFEDGLILIDSPGLEENISRTKTTQKFLPKADAIIFSLNATALLGGNEMTYIYNNFNGKHLRNVFFVINRINQINPGELETNVMPLVESKLKGVFTDYNGKFDRELYNKRVFYVDALSAFCARTGKPLKVLVARREYELEPDLEGSGIPEFEAALKEFLNSGERINAKASSSLTNMMNIYQNTTIAARKSKAAGKLTEEERQKNAKLAGERLKEAQSDVDDLLKTINDVGTNISIKLFNDAIEFVTKDMPSKFEDVVSDDETKSSFGMGSMIKLAAGNIPIINRHAPDAEEVLRPLTSKVEAWTKDQLENVWPERAATIIDADLKELEKTIEASADDLAVALDEAMNLFSYGKARTPFDGDNGLGAKGTAQSILALLNADVSLAEEIYAGGKMSWGDYIKRYAVQFGIDFAMMFVFGGVVWPITFVIEIIQMKKASTRMAGELVAKIGDHYFKEIANAYRKGEIKFKQGIQEKYAQKGREIASIEIAKLDEAKAAMDKILKTNASDKKAAEDEYERVDKNLASMRKIIGKVYKEINDVELTDAEFEKLLGAKKKK